MEGCCAGAETTVGFATVTCLLEARELRKSYRRNAGVFSGAKGPSFAAVDGVTFSISSGEALAIVGESGYGKTTLARMLLRLIEPDSGEIQFQGRDLLPLGGEELRRQRRQMQMIFQDPFASSSRLVMSTKSFTNQSTLT